MNEKIRRNLKRLADNVGVSTDEVNSVFRANLETVKEILELEIEDKNKREEEYEKIAYNRTQSYYKLRRSMNVEEIDAVILGMGRAVDWAKIQRTKIDKIIKEKGTDYAIRAGLIDTKNNYFYQDELRKGRQIPESDYSISFFGVSKTGENFIPFELVVKDKEAAQVIPLNKRVRIRVQKNPNKSYEGYNYFRLFSSDIKILEDLNPEEISQLNTLAFSSDVIEFDESGYKKLLLLEGQLRKKVTLKGFTVQNIREDVGMDKSCQIALDTPTIDVEGYQQIIVYLPKLLYGQAIEGYPTNIFCELVGYNQEKKSITVNGIACWLSPEYAKKIKTIEPPKEIGEKWE